LHAPRASVGIDLDLVQVRNVENGRVSRQTAQLSFTLFHHRSRVPLFDQHARLLVGLNDLVACASHFFDHSIHQDRQLLVLQVLR